jgi:hypothetical protein
MGAIVVIAGKLKPKPHQTAHELVLSWSKKADGLDRNPLDYRAGPPHYNGQETRSCGYSAGEHTLAAKIIIGSLKKTSNVGQRADTGRETGHGTSRHEDIAYCAKTHD